MKELDRLGAGIEAEIAFHQGEIVRLQELLHGIGVVLELLKKQKQEKFLFKFERDPFFCGLFDINPLRVVD